MHHPSKENVIFINLRGEHVECTQKDRDAFLKDNLALKYEDDRDILLDLCSLHLHLTLASLLFAAIAFSPESCGQRLAAVGSIQNP
jgi:hypothetical protein